MSKSSNFKRLILVSRYWVNIRYHSSKNHLLAITYLAEIQLQSKGHHEVLVIYFLSIVSHHFIVSWIEADNTLLNPVSFFRENLLVTCNSYCYSHIIAKDCFFSAKQAKKNSTQTCRQFSSCSFVWPSEPEHSHRNSRWPHNILFYEVSDIIQNTGNKIQQIILWGIFN